MNGTAPTTDSIGRTARTHTALLDGLDAPRMDFTIGPARRRLRVARRLRRLLP